MRSLYLFAVFVAVISCKREPNVSPESNTCFLIADSAYQGRDSTLPEQLVAFAQTLLGKPYKFGCAAPGNGFDCSGFINYVFDHFDIDVPRSSVDFTDKGINVSLNDAQPGDLILFTGTNSEIRKVGHIGLIIANDSSGISFIHASSGTEHAVIITLLNDRYMERFVKVIRLVRVR